jgi:two-component system NtrC family sensor kinase
MNQTELNWLGYTREEVVGKMHVSRIIAPDEHASYHDSFSLFQKQGYVRNKQHTFVRKDGSKFKVLLNATAIYDAQGNYVMSRGVTYLNND